MADISEFGKSGQGIHGLLTVLDAEDAFQPHDTCIEDFCERVGNEYKKQQNRTAQQEQNRTTPKKERGESR